MAFPRALFLSRNGYQATRHAQLMLILAMDLGLRENLTCMDDHITYMDLGKKSELIFSKECRNMI